MTNGSHSTVRLVLAVARLGEADLHGWARSNGLSSTGEFVLGRLFRSTAPVVALELDIVSASRRHSDALGRPTAVHLFSDQLALKRLALEWLGEQKLETEPDELIGELAAWNAHSARTRLADWAGDPPSGERLGDGLRLGDIAARDLTDPHRTEELGRALAAVYPTLDGSPPAFPYYDIV